MNAVYYIIFSYALKYVYRILLFILFDAILKNLFKKQ